MSFRGGSTKNLQLPEQTLLGIDEKLGTTNEAGRAVPVMYGKRRMGITLVTQAFNVVAEPITEKFGKKRVTTGHRYQCDWAGVICHGPVDVLEAIYMDRVLVWPDTGGGPLNRNDIANLVVSVDVTNGGSGYSALLTTVSITGDGAGATAVPVIDEDTGSIKAILVTNIGINYSVANVVISGNGTGATAVANIGSEPFVNLTIPGFGIYRFYWGTETQQMDAALQSLSSDQALNPDGLGDGNVAEQHGAYAGICYLVAVNHVIGVNRQNLQNIEVVVGRYPVRSWLEDSAVSGDCSIAAVLADMAANDRYGLGLNETDVGTVLDRASFGSVHTTLKAEGISVSPVIDRAQPFQQFAAELLEYCDGWATVTDGGKLGIGLVRGVPCDDPSIPVIDETCLSGDPTVEVKGFGTTNNLVSVKFRNRFAYFNEDSTSGQSVGGAAVLGEHSAIVLNRQWITRPELADYTARVSAKVLSIPEITGTLQILESKLQGIRAGDPFYFSHAQFGACFVHARALSVTRRRPGDPELTVEWEVDRNYQVELSFVGQSIQGDTVNTVAPEPFVGERAIELPYDEVNGEAPTIGFLASRPNKLTRRFNVYWQDDNLSFNQVMVSDQFAWSGTLATSMEPEDEDSIRILLTGADRLLPNVPESDADRGRLVAIVGDEILSIYDVTLIAGNEWSFAARREWMDTKRGQHALGAKVWIFWKDDFRRAGYLAKDGTTAVGGVQKFKLQPVVGDTPYELASITTEVAVTFSNRSRRHWKPRNLSGPDSFNGSVNVSFTWEPNSRNETGLYGPDFNNPITVVELRRVPDSNVYPNANPVWRTELDPNETGITVSMAEMAQKFGSLQTFFVRVYCMAPGGLESWTYLEKQVTFAP